VQIKQASSKLNKMLIMVHRFQSCVRVWLKFSTIEPSFILSTNESFLCLRFHIFYSFVLGPGIKLMELVLAGTIVFRIYWRSLSIVHHLLHIVQTGSGVHPTSYKMGIGSSFPGVKRQGRKADHSPPTSAEVKKMWIYTSTPIYCFMA
jgi:hypothetical protein